MYAGGAETQQAKRDKSKRASKKRVYMGVFLEYGKARRNNAIIIHVVLCCDETLMVSVLVLTSRDTRFDIK